MSRSTQAMALAPQMADIALPSIWSGDLTRRVRLVHEVGAPRLFVGFRLHWVCEAHGEDVLETARGAALVDTGSPNTTIPATFLPAGHVSWEDLRPGGMIPTMGGPVEWRWWSCAVTVEGVEITRSVRVLKLSELPSVTLGMDFMQHFDVMISAGADPPGWAYRRRMPDGPAILPADMTPVDYDDLVLLDYGEEGYIGVSEPGKLPELRRPQLTAPPPVPRLGTPPPSRAQRRAAARERS